jgi:glycosyltransferase involved in cell wall biosynthesis
MEPNLKIAVYAISKNEEKFVKRFCESAADADLILIADTGSTDSTVAIARECNATVHDIYVNPWRFDVARNTSLNLIPNDIDLCICLDLDEILMPGWRELLTTAWKANNGHIDRVKYDFIWNWKEDGVTPDVRFLSAKIHHRKNYIWRHPCHESLYWAGAGEEKCITLQDLQIQHHADHSKSRGQYLPLLKQAVTEDPENDRMRYYYARELMYYNHFEECIKESLHHLSMPAATWNEERAASYRNISNCYRQLGKMFDSQQAALKGVIECLGSREAWLQLSLISQLNKDWNTSYWAAVKCLEIKTRTMSYTGRSSSWGSDPYDHAALAAYYLGKYQEAVEYGTTASELSPNNSRLQSNLEFYKLKHTENNK